MGAGVNATGLVQLPLNGCALSSCWCAVLTALNVWAAFWAVLERRDPSTTFVVRNIANFQTRCDLDRTQKGCNLGAHYLHALLAPLLASTGAKWHGLMLQVVSCVMVFAMASLSLRSFLLQFRSVSSSPRAVCRTGTPVARQRDHDGSRVDRCTCQRVLAALLCVQVRESSGMGRSRTVALLFAQIMGSFFLAQVVHLRTSVPEDSR